MGSDVTGARQGFAGKDREELGVVGCKCAAPTGAQQ